MPGKGRNTPGSRRVLFRIFRTFGFWQAEPGQGSGGCSQTGSVRGDPSQDGSKLSNDICLKLRFLNIDIDVELLARQNSKSHRINFVYDLHNARIHPLRRLPR